MVDAGCNLREPSSEGAPFKPYGDRTLSVSGIRRRTARFPVERVPDEIDRYCCLARNL